MSAMKNATHLAVLALWAVAGALFTLKVLFAATPAVSPALLYWGWFAGLAALTSFVVSQLEHPLSALGAHAAVVFAMQVVPVVLPFSLLRLGLDLLGGAR